MEFYTQLVASLEEPFRTEAEGLHHLADWLQQTIDYLVQSYPGWNHDPPTFLEYLAQCIMQYPSKKGIQDWFEHWQSDDLYLAWACSQGQDQALAAFESKYGSVLQSVVRRFPNAPISEEDLQQVLREKLFVGSTKTGPKITSYSGQGFLENWLRVTTLRTCLDATRSNTQRKREQLFEEDGLARIPDEVLDVELDFLKREYRTQFKEAFAQALRGLQHRERNLLRQHLISGLSIDQIGKLYNIHRSTAARQLAKARQALQDGTRQELMKRLRISSNEFQSIFQLIQSRLEVSMHRLLRAESTFDES